ncbi:hypothetical protein ACNR91_001588 [Candidozyma auris]
MKRLQIREESKIIADSNQGDTTRDRENTSNDTCHTNNEENSRKNSFEGKAKKGPEIKKAWNIQVTKVMPKRRPLQSIVREVYRSHSEETRETLNEPLQKEYARLQKQLEKQWYDGVYKRYPYPLSEEEYGALSDEMEGSISGTGKIMTPEELERHYSRE